MTDPTKPKRKARIRKLRDLIREAGLMCGARTKTNNYAPCQLPPFSLVTGNGRCARWHGGKSTGPKTAEGMRNSRIGARKGGLKTQATYWQPRIAKRALDAKA